MASTNITTFPGKVGISNANPTHTLAIGSNVYVDDTGVNKLVVNGNISATGQFAGDGAGLSNIQTSNVIGLTDNVTRIGTLETDLSDNSSRIGTLETDLTDNVTRIGTLETDLTDNVARIGTLETDLSDNSSRITSIESGDITITGVKTFQDDIILESNLRVQGDLLVANTVNMTVSDPILELGSNNLNTGDVGLVMTRHGAANSNVTIVYDESEDVLNIGYTLSGANETTIELDSNALAVNVQGALSVASIAGDGSALSGIQSSNVSDFASNVARIASLESSDMTIDGEKTFSSNLEVGTANLFVDTTTGNVGVGTTNPTSKLDVNGSLKCNSFTLESKPGDYGEFIVERKDNGYTQGHLPLAHITPFGWDVSIADANYTTTTSKLTFTIDDDNTGSRWMLKFLHNDADTTIVRVRVNTGTLHGFAYNDVPEGSRENGDRSWTTIDITDDVVYAGAENTIYWWAANTDGGSILAAYVFPMSGPALPNEPVETDLHLYNDLYVRSNLEVGTADLFVDTATSNVGIGTSSPAYKLDVYGTSNVGALTATSGTFSGDLTAATIDAAKISNGTVGDSTGGIKAIYFDNTEQTGDYTDKSGILAFDENFYPDTEYGTGTYDPSTIFTGGNGGGLLIKNEDGWGAIFTSQNTRWAKGYWNSLAVSGSASVGALTATSGDFSTTLTVDGELTTKSNVFLGVMSGHETEGTLEFGRADGADRVHNIKVYNSATQASNYMKFQIHAGGTGTGALTDNVLYLRGDGNVGIGTDTPDAKLDVAGSAVFNTYMQVAKVINQVSSGTDVVLLLTPSVDGNKMSGTICGIDSLSGARFRSGTVKLEVIVNTNSRSDGHAQERFSFIKHAIINVGSTYTPVTCDYNGKNWFAIRIQGDGAEDPWYSWFSGLLQHNGGDDTLSIVSNDGVNVTNVVDFTAKETVQHTEFSNQDLIVSGGNVGIGTASPVSILHVKGTGQTSTTSFDTSQTLGASIFTESSDSVVGSGGSLLFGTYQGKFAAIKAGILDGTSNTMGNLHFMTRNATGDATLTNRMTITNTGDVGIGTVSPGAKLHVNGDIYSPGVICQTQQYEYSSVGTVVITSGTLTLLNCLFTPKFSNSKILIQLSIPVQSSATYFNVFVDRGSTRITSNPGNYGIISYNSTVNLGGHFIHTGVGYDLPGTTSQISYNVVAEYGSGSQLGILTQSGKLLVLIHELCQ
jgi:hypothetical protein